jgi:hypothetical protein
MSIIWGQQVQHISRSKRPPPSSCVTCDPFC